jgi:hypothetical protein
MIYILNLFYNFNIFNILISTLINLIIYKNKKNKFLTYIVNNICRNQFSIDNFNINVLNIFLNFNAKILF